MNKSTVLYVVGACVVVVLFWGIVNEIAAVTQALAVKMNAGG